MIYLRWESLFGNYSRVKCLFDDLKGARQMIRKSQTIDLALIEEDDVRETVKELMSFMLKKTPEDIGQGLI